VTGADSISIHDEATSQGGKGQIQNERIKLEAVFHSGPRVRGVSFPSLSFCPHTLSNPVYVIFLIVFFYMYSQRRGFFFFFFSRARLLGR
jgi:hypothetical protein